MLGKRVNEKKTRRWIHPRLVWGIVVLVTGISVSMAGCQRGPGLTPSVSTTLTSTSILSTTQVPTLSSQNLISPTPSLRPTADEANAFVIQLRTRQFVPEAEIQSGLDWLHTVSHKRVHVLLQLYEPPKAADKTLLERSGIHLLDYVPSNAWFASVPSTLQISDPALVLVRWFGPILPEDKMPAGLLDGSIGDWALRGGNKIALEIAFFDDVNLDDGQQILLKYDAVVIGSIPLSNKLTVEISKDVILLLAAEDSIRWIDVVPPPPTTDSEGG